jgi:divalent metal cation (Fe/Co/Zn/Cd) transporter
MATAAQTSAPDLVRRAQRLQYLTVVWMTAEAIIALTAAWRAQSPALLGFGGDSVIKLLSATVVLWRFRSKSQFESVRAEKAAARIAGGLLFLVAGFVAITSALALVGYGKPKPSPVGIILLVVAAFGMPWLASQKRKLATRLSSVSPKGRGGRVLALRIPILDRARRITRQRGFSPVVG